MSTQPIWLAERVTPTTAELDLLIPVDLDYFAGHFPGAPIVAGVVQLKWAVESARRLLGVTGVLAGMDSLKFQRVLVPKSVATLRLEWAPAQLKLYFSYRHEHVQFSSGRLLFRAEP
jgi:3-hydroxymyristoyl/3-hydroxydecanoyl-(acyl carrier protein) dehydratase